MANKDSTEINGAGLKYDNVKNNEKTFLSMTSLTVAEFENLLVNFEKTLKKLESKNEENGQHNKGGRPSVLDLTQDKLLFILFYLKNYPLQEVIGAIFGLSQPRANYWVHFLSKVLEETLKEMDFMPARVPSELLEKLQSEEEQDLSVDGTDRRINRPQDNEEQKEYYSGKQKAHTVKNLVIVGNSDREVKYLGDTVEPSFRTLSSAGPHIIK